jgi:hypothetical protein
MFRSLQASQRWLLLNWNADWLHWSHSIVMS